MRENSFGSQHVQAAQFKVYPRGFLGAKLQDRVQQDTTLVQDNMGFVPVKAAAYKKSNGINDYNHAIQELFSAHVREEPGVLSFEFRERVLRAAVRAFGTPFFDTWFLAQLQSPFVGRNQRDFLDDCLRFLMGQRRHLTLPNWAALLTIENADEGTLQPSKVAREYFGLNGNNGVRKLTVQDTIQSWCSQPGGHEDLLCALQILFGAAP